MLCDADCQAKLDGYTTQTLKSGVKIVDIKEGTGASPPVGLQVVVNYGASCWAVSFCSHLSQHFWPLPPPTKGKRFRRQCLRLLRGSIQQGCTLKTQRPWDMGSAVGADSETAVQWP